MYIYIESVEAIFESKVQSQKKIPKRSTDMYFFNL